jgi:hypothetical protein
MPVTPIVVVLMVALIATASAVAGLVNGILHHADGASLPAAIRAGGRAGLAVLTVLLTGLGVLAGWLALR